MSETPPGNAKIYARPEGADRPAAAAPRTLVLAVLAIVVLVGLAVYWFLLRPSRVGGNGTNTAAPPAATGTTARTVPLPGHRGVVSFAAVPSRGA